MIHAEQSIVEWLRISIITESMYYGRFRCVELRAKEMRIGLTLLYFTLHCDATIEFPTNLVHPHSTASFFDSPYE